MSHHRPPRATRPATAREAARDYAKREAALEDAEAEGLYSPKQLDKYRAELAEFTGYRRPFDQPEDIK